MNIIWRLPSASALSIRIGILNLAEHWGQLILEKDYTGNKHVSLQMKRGQNASLVLNRGQEKVSFEVSEDQFLVKCNYVRFKEMGHSVKHIIAKVEINIYKKLPTSDSIQVLETDVSARSVRDMENRISNDLQSLLSATSK